MSAPVHDPVAERYLLAAVLASEGARDLVLGELQPEDLHTPDHRTLLAACCALTASQSPVDDLGVHGYLLANDAPHSACQAVLDIGASTTFVSLDSVEKRVARVKDLAAVRRVVSRAASMLAASGAIEDPSSWLDGAEQAITEAAQSRADDGQMYTAAEVVEESIGELTARSERGGGAEGYLSGLSKLDAQLGGFAPGRLYVFAGRPGCGKSVIGKDALLGIVQISKRSGLAISLEMPRRELMDRMICSEAGVLYESWRNADLKRQQWDAVKAAGSALADLPMFMVDKPRAAVEHVARWARRVQRRKGAIGVVMVDYLQLLGTAHRIDNREQQVAHISRSLKAMAKELDCPVIALAQLNRIAESRADKRPLLSELRESGAIEQDADVVCLMYRDEYYNPESPKAGVVEVNVAKNRAGRTGVVELAFQGHYVRIANLETHREHWQDSVREPGF